MVSILGNAWPVQFGWFGIFSVSLKKKTARSVGRFFYGSVKNLKLIHQPVQLKTGSIRVMVVPIPIVVETVETDFGIILAASLHEYRF
jgi:hypothetical protein